MSGAFDPGAFDPVAFDTGDITGPTGFIPRGSVGAIATPTRASASVSVPAFSTTVTVPDRPTAEVE